MTDPFTTPAPLAAADFKRDRWGRPLIKQPDGSRKPYTRASAAAKTIEDTYNLELWARRNVAYGLATDPSLIARLLAVGGTPHEWDNAAKKTVNEICDAAATVAQAHRAADIGTALHAILEQCDRGQTYTAGPYQPDVDAYLTALEQLGLQMLPEYVECRMVCDPLELAGTADNIAVLDGRHVICDKKTGASVEYAVLGYAAQLAAYANSHLYDVATEERQPTPDLDREHGYIIHLPAGQGECSIYQVNLTEGYAAAELANRVRTVRKNAKTWMVPATPAAAGTDARRQRLRERYAALTNEDQLAFVALGIDPDDLDAIEAALDKVDPFAQQLPPTTPASRPPAERAATLDEGPDASADEIDRLRAAWEFLDPPQAEWVQKTVAAAGNLSVQQRPSARRVAIGTAIVQLAVAGWGDDDLLAVLVTHAVGQPTALADLDHDAAAKFATAVDDLIADRLTVEFADGLPVISEPNPNPNQASEKAA